MNEQDLRRVRNMALSLEMAIIEDYFMFDLIPFGLRSTVQLGSGVISAGPDYIRSTLEPMVTMAAETGDVAKGLGKLTNIIG